MREWLSFSPAGAELEPNSRTKREGSLSLLPFPDLLADPAGAVPVHARAAANVGGACGVDYFALFLYTAGRTISGGLGHVLKALDSGFQGFLSYAGWNRACVAHAKKLQRVVVISLRRGCGSLVSCPLHVGLVLNRWIRVLSRHGSRRQGGCRNQRGDQNHKPA